MTNILLYNFGFWFNIIIPIAIGFFLYLKHKEYVLKEFLIQILASFLIVIGLNYLFFKTTTDLFDKEYQNSKVSAFEYYEAWTERVEYYDTVCTGSGSSRSCRTVKKVRYDYHPPYWEISTTNNEKVSITKTNYKLSANRFNNETKVYLNRSGQSSFGDGNKFVVKPNTILPIAVGHEYVNYVKEAKDNIIHNIFTKEEIKVHLDSGNLKNYPKEITDELGISQIYRVINHEIVPNININDYLNKMNFLAYEIGKAKQANPIIYFTNQDRSFADVIEYHWAKGRKNDVILLLGINDKGDILWTKILAWTNNTDFLVDGTKFLNDLNLNATNTDAIIKEFKELTIKGFQRKPMKEFEYLAENITLAWYIQILIILLNILISGAIFFYFLNNQDGKGYITKFRRF